ERHGGLAGDDRGPSVQRADAAEQQRGRERDVDAAQQAARGGLAGPHRDAPWPRLRARGATGLGSIPVRRRVGAVVTAGAMFAVLVLLDYRATRTLLVYGFDDELRTHAGALASLVREQDGGLVLQLDEQALPFYRSGPNAEYFEVWDDRGHVVSRSESLGT